MNNKIKIKFGTEFNDDLNMSNELGDKMQLVWDILQKARGNVDVDDDLIDGCGEPRETLNLDMKIIENSKKAFSKKEYEELINLIDEYKIIETDTDRERAREEKKRKDKERMEWIKGLHSNINVKDFYNWLEKQEDTEIEDWLKKEIKLIFSLYFGHEYRKESKERRIKGYEKAKETFKRNRGVK